MGFGLGSLGNLLGATLDSVKVSVLGHDGLVDAHVGAAKGVVGGLLGAHAGDVGLSVGGHDGLLGLKIGGLDAHTGNDHHGWHC